MKSTGFTLIELLVVISIVALLMAILAPTSQSVRQQARTVLCGSNIKQLTLGLLAYETENQTLPYGFDNTPVVPPLGGYPGYAQYDRMGWWWFNYIGGLYNKAESKKTVLHCPSKKLRNRRLKNNILCGNYGVNQSICKSSSGSHADFIGTPLCSSDIPHPGQTLLVVDSGYSMITWCHATDILPDTVTLGNTIEDTAYIPGLPINDAKSLWAGQKQDAINGRHPNKSVNVGYVDGHVSRTKADDLFVEKSGDDYKNLRPLWLPKQNRVD